MRRNQIREDRFVNVLMTAEGIEETTDMVEEEEEETAQEERATRFNVENVNEEISAGFRTKQELAAAAAAVVADIASVDMMEELLMEEEVMTEESRINAGDTMTGAGAVAGEDPLMMTVEVVALDTMTVEVAGAGEHMTIEEAVVVHTMIVEGDTTTDVAVVMTIAEVRTKIVALEEAAIHDTKTVALTNLLIN